jgi:hypothetical protein
MSKEADAGTGEVYYEYMSCSRGAVHRAIKTAQTRGAVKGGGSCRREARHVRAQCSLR